jgi:hypothetical protein
MVCRFEKKANKMLQIATQTLEHSTGFTLGTRRSALHLGEARVIMLLIVSTNIENIFFLFSFLFCFLCCGHEAT